jgi:hypothetical protein
MRPTPILPLDDLDDDDRLIGRIGVRPRPR